MWQSGRRMVAALLITVVSAVVMAGTVKAKEPPPFEPPRPGPIALDVTTVVNDEWTSSFVVTDQHTASAFGVVLGASVPVNCKSVTHRVRYGSLKFDGDAEWCWTQSAPYTIQGGQSFSARAWASWPTYAVSASHSKSSGGNGFTYVKSKGKGKYCTEVEGECPGYDVIRLKATHKIHGQSSASATLSWEG